MVGAVTTSMHFLQRLDLYNEQKPYSLRFNPDDPSFARTNVKLERHNDIRIEDLRGLEDTFTLEQDGFCVLDLNTSMAYEDFDDEAKIRSIFLQQVSDLLRDKFEASRVQIFEHTLRKRHETFPIATGGTYRYNQPTATAHIDSTAEWVNELIKQMNDDSVAEKLLRNEFRCVNVWVPLKGPVCDWPLALCHPATLELERDGEATDLVYPRYCIETYNVYWHPGQKWYYLSEQQPNEALVFLQSSSSPNIGPGVPHSSFPHPRSTEHDIPRESIEVRAVLFSDKERPDMAFKSQEDQDMFL